MGSYNVVPTNEMMVREWFVAHIDEFDFNIVHSQAGYPDWTLADDKGKRFRVEVEYQSSGFIFHKHDPKECDFVICWKHNSQLPFRVLELSTGKWYESDEIPLIEDEETQLATLPPLLPDKDEIRQAISNIDPGLINEFLQAMAADLIIRSEYTRKLAEPRLKALKAADDIVKALQGNGIKIKRIHPDDLLHLLVA